MASFSNKERVLTVLKRLPPAMKLAVQETLEEEAAELVEAMKRACPVGHDLEHTPGDLRDSIHAEDGSRALRSGGTRTELLKTVTADAKDENGKVFIGPPVEFGHLTKAGGHVPAHPFFFPTWRAHRAGIKRRMTQKGRAAARAIAGDWAK